MGVHAPIPDQLTRDPAVIPLTPAELGQPGWRWMSGQRSAPPTAVTSGPIHGAVSRLVRVAPADLPHVHPSDREYVASEMTAFLAAFLISLRCRLFNRPDPANLTGPPFSAEHWMRLAASLGLAVCLEHCAETTLPEHTVVGQSIILADGSPPHPRRAEIAAALARGALVSHIGVQFCARHTDRIAGVSCQPELTEIVWAAMREFLLGS